jgi:hypothetical protein
MASFLLLLQLKLRLMARTFTGRAGTTVLATIGLGLAFLPMCVGLTATAYLGARRFGAPAVAVGLGLVHVGWVAATLLLASFAEGIDMRLLLRYPVRPRAMFWLNVLIAPLDLVSLFLLPPLVALAIGTARRSGTAAGVEVALAALLLVLITTALSQTLLAALGRYLRREWTRALFGLLVGVVFMLPTLLMRGLERKGGGGLPPELAQRLPDVAALFAWFPSTALPVRAALAAAEAGRPAAIVYLAAAAVLLLVVVDVGARIAVREAMNRVAGGEGRSHARKDEATASASSPVLRLDRGGPTSELATMIAREWRTYLRTPQVIMGLLMIPVLLLVLGRGSGFSFASHPFLLTFLCISSALNLSGNQFGLDQAGVRLLFLLPILPRRLLLAKNLALVALVATVTAACLGLAALAGGMTVQDALTAVAALAAALPVALTLGTFLSVYHPWRMVFRLGGAPPGAMISAFSQMAAMGVVALLLLLPMSLLPILLANRASDFWIAAASFAATLVFAGALWAIWWVMLGVAARALVARRERIIDRLARPGETG